MNIFWFLKPKTTSQSKINGQIVIGLKDKEKALFSGGVTQSGGEIKPMWDKVINDLYNCHPEMLKRVQHDKERKILVLGVGGGSVIQSIRTYDTTAQITGIELDPIMKQVALEQFGIEEHKKQNIIIADAIDFLMNQAKQNQYDLIIVDLYIGPLNPAKARTKKFMERLKTVLKPKGSILYNAHYQKNNPLEYKNFRDITDKIFLKVEEVFSYPLNKVLLLNPL